MTVVLGHTKPAAALDGLSCAVARAGSAARQIPGRFSQNLLHLLPPAHIVLPVTHPRHVLGPAKTEPDLLLLALPRQM